MDALSAELHLSPSHFGDADCSFLMAAGVVDVEVVLLDGLLLEGLGLLLDVGIRRQSDAGDSERRGPRRRRTRQKIAETARVPRR